jgi:exopolyphosphatase/pppGpp-phosphohydrolase
MAAPRKSVTLVYDGTEPAHRALAHAAELVGRGGTLTVINVISVKRVSSRLQTVSDEERATQDHLLAEADRLLAVESTRTSSVLPVIQQRRSSPQLR